LGLAIVRVPLRVPRTTRPRARGWHSWARSSRRRNSRDLVLGALDHRFGGQPDRV